jgi:hypothetical protein
VAVIGGTWYIAVQHLYSLPADALASFTTLTVNAQYVVGAIVVFMVSGRLIYEWKMDTASKIEEAGKRILSIGTRPKDFDDLSIQ